MIVKQINDHDFTPANFAKNILLAATDTTALAEQTAVDQTIVNSATLSPEQCKQTTFTKEELTAGTKKAVTTNEDVGRYVGYGWKDITKGGGLNLGYGLLRMFYPRNNTCYGVNAAAKLLCKNAQAIESFNVPTLQSLFAQVAPGTKAYDLLS